jgi:2-oxoglutarate dehydrogenase E2 component (dihydrolipoamide succinyltransferase)
MSCCTGGKNIGMGERMKTEVSIPEIGESVTGGIIAAWLKGEGDEVREGEDLFELETDKATLAVPSPASGILSVITQEGEEVAVGQVVAVIAESTADTVQKDGKKDRVAYEINIEEKIEEPRISPAPSVKVSSGKAGMPPLSPAVRLLVEQYELDPAEIRGTGKEGRITKKDVLYILEQRESGVSKKQDKPKASMKPSSTEAKTRAEMPSEIPVEAPAQAPVQPKPAGAGQHRVKMTSIRKRIAENLLLAKQSAAHVTTFNEVDMSRVMSLRKTYRDSFEKRHGVRLGFMSFFVKACCNALAVYPVLNAYINGEDIVYNNSFNIGIAVSTERGLIVPVIRHADQMGFADIEKTIRNFAARAREKKLTVDELTGGTFTITNGGVFGSMLSTPIPSPPQSAILGMHAIKERPVVEDGEIIVQPVMYVALTYDHRLIDGREAVSFLVLLKEEIEDPERMLIDI